MEQPPTLRQRGGAHPQPNPQPHMRRIIYMCLSSRRFLHILRYSAQPRLGSYLTLRVGHGPRDRSASRQMTGIQPAKQACGAGWCGAGWSGAAGHAEYRLHLQVAGRVLVDRNSALD